MRKRLFLGQICIKKTEQALHMFPKYTKFNKQKSKSFVSFPRTHLVYVLHVLYCN